MQPARGSWEHVVGQVAASYELKRKNPSCVSLSSSYSSPGSHVLLVTQAHLLTGDFQPGLYCSGRKQVSGSDPQDCKGSSQRKGGVFCGEDQSVRVWKIFVDLCGCTSLRPLFWVHSLSDYSGLVGLLNMFFSIWPKITKITEGIIKLGFCLLGKNIQGDVNLIIRSRIVYLFCGGLGCCKI